MNLSNIPKLIILLFCAFFILFVAKYAINLPYQDDVNLLQTTLIKNDPKALILNLFSADSDHIQVYPKLTAILQYKIFGLVDFKWLAIWMNLLVITALFFLISIPKNIKKHYSFLPIFLFILQPQLYEISFWVLPGLQHSYALLFVILSVYCLDIRKKYNWLSLFWAASATFCTGNGLLAFFGIIYILFLYRKPIWYALGSFLVCFSIYLTAYKPSPAVTNSLNFANIFNFMGLFWASPFEVFNRLHLHKTGGIVIFVAFILIGLFISIQTFKTKSIASLPVMKLLSVLIFCAGTGLLISLSREYDVIFSRFQFYAFMGFSAIYLIILETTNAHRQKFVVISIGGLFTIISLFSYFSNFVKIENMSNKYLADTFNWSQNKTMMMVDQPFLDLVDEVYNKNTKITNQIVDNKVLNELINNTLSHKPTKGNQLKLEQDLYPRRYFAKQHFLLLEENFDNKINLNESYFLIFSNKNKNYIIAPQLFANFKGHFLKTHEYYKKGFFADIPTLNFEKGIYHIYYLHKNKNNQFKLFDTGRKINFLNPIPVIIN